MCIEQVCYTKEQSYADNDFQNLQVTYYIRDMKVSKLSDDVLNELEKRIIPILETRILL